MNPIIYASILTNGHAPAHSRLKLMAGIIADFMQPETCRQGFQVKSGADFANLTEAEKRTA